MQLVAIATRPAKKAAMKQHEGVFISITEGIDGDYRNHNGNRQISVLSLQQWQQACEQIGVSLPWTTRRANLLIDNWYFSQEDIGKVLCIGQVKLQICAQTEPCFKMDRQHDGLQGALRPDWRGGVCCKVLNGGVIRCADPVQILSQ